MRKEKRPLAAAVLSLLLAGALAAAAPAGAQAPAGGRDAAPAGAPPPAMAAPPGAPDEPFAESIQVTVVNVDVVVRDKSGRQVPGLTRADFSLFVDGKPVEITNFAAGGAESPAAGGPAAATAPAAPNAAPAATAAPRREPLSLVAYIDNANMRPPDRNRLLKQLRTFLDRTLAPGDRILVVSADPGLRVRHPFSAGLASLPADLDQLAKDSGTGLNKDILRRQTMEEIQDLIQNSGKNGGCGSMFDSAKAQAQAYAEQVTSEVRLTYATLHHLLRSLGGLDGRKALIYVGDGVPVQPGTDVFGQLQELCPAQAMQAHVTSQTVSTTAPMRQVIADANANLVTLYMLEASGLPSYASAEHAGKPLISFELAREIDFDRQGSLTNLAQETGGRVALNGNDFSRDLAEIAADLNGSYSLGFTPERAGEGRVHEIRVEVRRPGLHAIHRSSYRDRTAEERLEGQVEAALIHGLDGGSSRTNPLGAALKLGAATPAEHGRVLVPVKVIVPFSALAFLPGGDARHGRVTIVIGNIDARGGMAPLQRKQLPLRISDADAKRVLASHLGYDVKLLVEPGRQRLAFIVRDDVAHLSSTVIQEIDVDKNGTAVPVAAAAAGPSR
jgi:VWFA-related protein